jgi:hypothetical protein
MRSCLGRNDSLVAADALARPRSQSQHAPHGPQLAQPSGPQPRARPQPRSRSNRACSLGRGLKRKLTEIELPSRFDIHAVRLVLTA